MSRIVAILPVRNEGWILGCSLRALMRWVDSVVVLNHASTDNTGAILDALVIEYGTGRVTVMEDNDPTWREMSQRQKLLDAARFLDASHVVIVDADEILTANFLPIIRAMVERTPHGQVLQLPWLQMRGSINQVHTTGLWGQQNASVAFPDMPEYCWKAQNGYDHHHRHPMGRSHIPYMPMGMARTGGIMHFQMVSDQRLRAKQALYLMIETIRWPHKRTAAELNKMYGPTVYAVDKMAPTPSHWWIGYEDLMQYLNVDAEPWQLAEVKRLIAEHGREKFAGLDLFGVV